MQNLADDVAPQRRPRRPTEQDRRLNKRLRRKIGRLQKKVARADRRLAWPNRPLDAWPLTPETALLRGPLQAQLRTRTGDSFLTMEVLYQLS